GPRGRGRGDALHLPAAAHRRRCRPQPDRGGGAGRDRTRRGPGRVEQRPDDARRGTEAERLTHRQAGSATRAPQLREAGMYALPRLPDRLAAVLSLTLPALLLAGLAATLAVQTGALTLTSIDAAAAAPETVRLAPGSFSYRP